MKHFDANDVELLEKVLVLCPDLDIVAYAAKLAREKIKYPIQDHDGLLPLFGSKPRSRVFKFKEHRVTFEQARQFLPEAFFPIESEDDFLRKVLMAFAIGRNSHFLDTQHTGVLGNLTGFPPATVMFRPSPSATSFK